MWQYMLFQNMVGGGLTVYTPVLPLMLAFEQSAKYSKNYLKCGLHFVSPSQMSLSPVFLDVVNIVAFEL